jgi:U4/U6 small nuclear ribonucleoprotein PRP3
VERIAHPLNEYKVVINVEENQLSGIGLKTDDFAIVIVEGARKAIARYNKLMLRRIDWKLRVAARVEEEEEDEDADAAEARRAAQEAEEEQAEAVAAGNKCTLVWQGAVLKAAFKRFKFEPIRTAAVSLISLISLLA